MFGEVGYRRASLREIAERAGVTRPAINHYFRGKHTLYEAASASAQDAVAAGRARSAYEPTAARRIGVFLQFATTVDARDPSYARFVTSSSLDAFRSPEIGESARANLEQARAFVRATLVEGIDAGETRSDLDVDATVEMLISVLWGIGLYAGFVGSHERLKMLVEQFTRLLEDGLFQDGSTSRTVPSRST